VSYWFNPNYALENLLRTKITAKYTNIIFYCAFNTHNKVLIRNSSLTINVIQKIQSLIKILISLYIQNKNYIYILFKRNLFFTKHALY